MNVYADNAATTKVSEAAVHAMIPFLSGAYGNPSSIHSAGRAARGLIEQGRKVFAKYMNASPEEILFTSSGSEANNQVIKSVAGAFGAGQFISTGIEHHSVINPLLELENSGCKVTFLEVSRDGEVSPEAVREAITPQTALVSVMFANNEIGTVQPVEQIGEICRKRGVLFHVDAVQAAGHMEVDVKRIKADYISISAHKFNGPKGTGILYHRTGAPLSPLICGGGQESGFRAGTENVAGIMGAATAFENSCLSMAEEAEYISAIRSRVEREIKTIPGACIFAEKAKQRLPGIVNVAFRNVPGEMLVHLLDEKGVFVSSGAACSSGGKIGSHVLRAIGVSEEYSADGVRISLSGDNTEAEVEYLISVLKTAVEQARACFLKLGAADIWSAGRENRP